MSRQHQDEDIVIELLGDIRQIFDARDADRSTSEGLCAALQELEARPWNEWRGVHENRPPRPLSQSNLSDLLRPFGIAPRSVWPIGPRSGAKSRKGYYRTQFESAWTAYVDLEDTDEDNSSQRAKAPTLRLV
jgi:hypothetical protein